MAINGFSVWSLACNPRQTVTSLIPQLFSLASASEELFLIMELRRILLGYIESIYQVTHQFNQWLNFARPIVARFNLNCRSLRQVIA